MTKKKIGKTDEAVEDIVGQLVTGSGDAQVTYDDAARTLVIKTNSVIHNSGFAPNYAGGN